MVGVMICLVLMLVVSASATGSMTEAEAALTPFLFSNSNSNQNCQASTLLGHIILIRRHLRTKTLAANLLSLTANTLLLNGFSPVLICIQHLVGLEAIQLP